LFDCSTCYLTEVVAHLLCISCVYSSHCAATRGRHLCIGICANTVLDVEPTAL
jgi:hypothetical protein